MVLKPGHVSFFARVSGQLNRQHEKKLTKYYEKKYLSSMTPFHKHQTYVRKKVDKFIDWYDEFTGMDEVRLAQKRVLEDEDQFRKAQEIRRRTLIELTEIQNKLKDLYVELENTSRGDDRYVILVTQEHKLLKEEKAIMEKFSRAEKLERDLFSALSSSVKLSHEKEKAQGERTKYWSIIGSVLGTVLGILGSSINNHFKMNELKQLIKNSTNMQIVDCLNAYIETNEKTLEKFKTQINATEFQNIAKLEDTLKSVTKRLAELEKSATKVEKYVEYNSKIVSDKECGIVVTVPAAAVQESLKHDYTQVKLLLITVTVLSIIMPILSRYS